MMDKFEFAKILAILEGMYPRFKLEPRAVEAYYAILGDLPTDLLKAATLQIGSEARPFFPAAGELRQVAFDLIDQQAGVPNAWDAWTEVCRKIGVDGHVHTPEFSHPLVSQTIDAVGGWLTLCMSENSVADRARFVQAYEVLSKRECYRVRMLPQVRATAARLAAGRQTAALETGDGSGD